MTDNRPSLAFSSKSLDRGLVEVFTGDGKGKTSAAMGIALRALGQKLRVHIIFFMKGNYPYSEKQALAQLPNISFSSYGQDYFVDPNNVKPEEKEQARKGLNKAIEVTNSGKYDVVILDEINLAVSWKLLDIDDVLKLIKNKPKNVELILTGRNADPKLIEVADLVTDMVKVKHPYDKGISARAGIDY
jgi:cob(I)alamin adenosyltransferase